MYTYYISDLRHNYVFFYANKGNFSPNCLFTGCINDPHGKRKRRLGIENG